MRLSAAFDYPVDLSVRATDGLLPANMLKKRSPSIYYAPGKKVWGSGGSSTRS
jgi:hypothetical protein